MSKLLKITKRKEAALLVTPYEGFGDLVFHTPTIRMLSRLFERLDVWGRNVEPFLNNPYITELYQLEKGRIPTPPSEVYGQNSFIVNGFGNNKIMIDLHSNVHTIDLVSICTLGVVLRPHEKTLEAFWTPSDEAFVKSLLTENDIVTNEFTNCNLVVISPAITWISRTLPLKFYQDLIDRITANGDKVVLVGKEVSYITGIDKDKTLYSCDNFPNAVCLYNKLSFAQLCALYSLAKIAINTESATNPISCTNDKCWNLFIPLLTAPEYRVPFRHGSQDWKVRVVGNEEDYYLASVYGSSTIPELLNTPPIMPTVDRVFDTYKEICRKFRQF